MITEYTFTHYFDNVPYNFKVTDIGFNVVAECNGKELKPIFWNGFEIVDDNGDKHTLKIMKGVSNRRCYIDGIQFYYMGLSCKYDAFMVYAPIFLALFLGIFCLMISVVNMLILKIVTTPILRPVFCIAVFIVGLALSISMNLFFSYLLGF